MVFPLANLGKQSLLVRQLDSVKQAKVIEEHQMLKECASPRGPFQPKFNLILETSNLEQTSPFFNKKVPSIRTPKVSQISELLVLLKAVSPRAPRPPKLSQESATFKKAQPLQRCNQLKPEVVVVRVEDESPSNQKLKRHFPPILKLKSI